MRDALESGLSVALVGKAIERCIAGGLDRFMAGDRSPEVINRMVRHARGCATCRAVFALEHRTARTGARGWRLGTWALAASAAVTAGFWITNTSEPAIRFKGGVAAVDATTHHAAPPRDALHVGVTRGSLSFRAQRGDALRDGDRLTLFHTSEEPGYVSVWNVDQEGEVTLLSVAAGADTTGTPVAVGAGLELPLPAGALVGPGSGCEWVVAVFSEQPLAPMSVSAALLESGWRDVATCHFTVSVPDARSVVVFEFRRP